MSLAEEGRALSSLNNKKKPTGPKINSLNSLIPIKLLFDVKIEVEAQASEKDDMRLVLTLSLVWLFASLSLPLSASARILSMIGAVLVQERESPFDGGKDSGINRAHDKVGTEGCVSQPD
ncbi:hypothetical protein Tco_0660379 [Tanacetum coccineum]